MATETVNQPTWNLNPTKKGIEIRFDQKPTPHILAELKAQGFRWSPRYRLWYAKDTETNREFAIQMTQQPPASNPTPYRPSPRRRTKPKFLVVFTGKQKPKAITKDAARFWQKHPDKVRVLYQVPGEWTANEARHHIKHGHPKVRILLGEHHTKAAKRRMGRLPRVLADLEGIYEKYSDPPGAYRIVLVDRAGTEYKYDPHRQTADKITGPALTQGVDVPLKELLARSELLILVQAYDDLIMTRQHGASIRGIGRTLEERPLGRN